MRSGPAYMIAAALSFTAMMVAVKFVREDMGALEAMVWRCVVGVPISALACAGRGFRVRHPRVVALRTALGTVSMTSFFVALGGLSLTELTLITRLQPIEVAILAPMFLGQGERPSRLAWGLISVAFVGCLVLLAPPDLVAAGASPSAIAVALGAGVTSTWGQWALLASITSAGAHVTLRAMADDDPRAIVFWFQLGSGLLALLAYVVTSGGRPPLPTLETWPTLAALGFFATLGQLLMTRAYAVERAAMVAAASYAEPAWTLAADWVWFGVLPTVQAIAGGSVIVAAGLVLLFVRDKPVSPRTRAT